MAIGHVVLWVVGPYRPPTHTTIHIWHFVGWNVDTHILLNLMLFIVF